MQLELKATVASLLRMHVKGLAGYRGAAEVQGLVADKVAGEINEDEATDIVKYLYNQNDAERVLKKLSTLFRTSRPRE